MKKIYILSSFDRWDEHFPWDIVGYVETKEEADKWVSEAKNDNRRKAEEVNKLKEQ